jgi:hypothetical protein
MITVSDFRLRFPEFEDPLLYSDDRIQLFIDDTILYMGDDEHHWCNKYDFAQAYLTAHLLVIGTRSEAGDTSIIAGPISSKTADGVSVTRAVLAKNRSDQDDFYMSTTYGQQFLMIRDNCFVGVRVANQL